MHRLLLGYPNSSIDHIDRNKLNNTGRNLRLCTSQQNSLNTAPRARTSVYKGVSRCKRNNKFWWGVYAKFPKSNRRFWGYYKSEIKAAEAYNDAALKYGNEFSYLNAF